MSWLGATRLRAPRSGYNGNMSPGEAPEKKAPRRRRRSPADAEQARAFAIAAARIAADNKAEEVVVLDLCGLSALADYFVIGTGTSERQMSAVLDLIADHAREVGRRAFNVADSSHGAWLLADYVDVVVHLFDEEHRGYYDLEGLWGDAPEIHWERAERPPREE